MGRPRKFKSAKALEAAVEAYFGSILRPVGGPNKRAFPVYSDDGAAVSWFEYVIPPSVTGLCHYLGIDKSTWALWASDDTLGPVVARTRVRMEFYLETELLRRKKSVEGVKFSLQNNYGWRTSVDVREELVEPVTFVGDAPE